MTEISRRSNAQYRGSNETVAWNASVSGSQNLGIQIGSFWLQSGQKIFISVQNFALTTIRRLLSQNFGYCENWLPGLIWTSSLMFD